jgi:pimeloyl-ACP methyl ester carboxylesterase
MLYNAKNGRISFPDGQMDYLRFGSGRDVLIMLPGLGDGLRSSYGLALPTAILYRMYARDYTVYMFSRKNQMPQGCTTADMARHVAQAMEILGIEAAHILGVSMGGMIAQHLAADFPEKVKKLILVVTAARPNPVLTDSVKLWMDQAERGDHTALMDSNLQRIYSPGYYRKNKWMVPLLGITTKPKSYDRFLVMAQACLDHNALEKLSSITAPTLVMGGGQDATLGSEAAEEIAAAISGAQLRIFPQWGHGLYEEAPEFNREVLEFLT